MTRRSRRRRRGGGLVVGVELDAVVAGGERHRGRTRRRRRSPSRRRGPTPARAEVKRSPAGGASASCSRTRSGTSRAARATAARARRGVLRGRWSSTACTSRAARSGERRPGRPSSREISRRQGRQRAGDRPGRLRAPHRRQPIAQVKGGRRADDGGRQVRLTSSSSSTSASRSSSTSPVSPPTASPRARAAGQAVHSDVASSTAPTRASTSAARAVWPSPPSAIQRTSAPSREREGLRRRRTFSRTAGSSSRARARASTRPQLGERCAAGLPVATSVRGPSVPTQTPARRPLGVGRNAARRA